MKEEGLSLSSSILPSVIEQETESDNKQESTLTFDSSVVLSKLLCVQFQKHKWKPAMLRLKTNSDLLILKSFCNKESEKSCLKIQHLSLPLHCLQPFHQCHYQ